MLLFYVNATNPVLYQRRSYETSWAVFFVQFPKHYSAGKPTPRPFRTRINYPQTTPNYAVTIFSIFLIRLYVKQIVRLYRYMFKQLHTHEDSSRFK